MCLRTSSITCGTEAIASGEGAGIGMPGLLSGKMDTEHIPYSLYMRMVFPFSWLSLVN